MKKTKRKNNMNMAKLKEQNAITLIALVVTIIVLIILAGISIGALSGEKGIIQNAKVARDETERAREEEQIDIAILKAEQTNEDATLEDVIEELKKDGIITDNTQVGEDGTVTSNSGEEFKEKLKDYIGKTEEEVPEILKPGQVAKTTTKNNYKDENNELATVPKGFHVSTKEGEQNVKDGLVIIDDDGNEFVWVPCDEEKGGVKYEKDSSKPNNNLAATWQEKYSKFQGNYKDYAWKDEGGDENSVKQYGGFYIGRFEAGLPKEYWKEQEDGTYELKWDGNYENMGQLSERINIPINYTPVSKKNNPSWNGITQENAKKVSKKMYENNSSVTSQLIDSYAWDTTVEWLAIGDNKIDPTDSTSYGNYLNSEIEINGLYEEYTRDFTNVQWTLPQTYKNGYLKTERREENGLQKIYCIATGSSENTKTKNIYDLAGNNAEYTTEIGDRKKDIEQESIIGTYAATRGGVPNMYGNILPISYRSGTLESNPQYVDLRTSFRIVLYIKSE